MYDILLSLLAIYAFYGRKHKGLDDGMKIILWLIVEHTAMSNCLNKINSKKEKEEMKQCDKEWNSERLIIRPKQKEEKKEIP